MRSKSDCTALSFPGMTEDEKMIVACANLMGTSDLFALKPVLLPGDAPAIRARRVLAALIEKEQAGQRKIPIHAA